MQLNGRVQRIIGRPLRVQCARVGVSLSLGGVLFRRARKVRGVTGVRVPDRPRFDSRRPSSMDLARDEVRGAVDRSCLARPPPSSPLRAGPPGRDDPDKKNRAEWFDPVYRERARSASYLKSRGEDSAARPSSSSRFELYDAVNRYPSGRDSRS